MIIFVFYGFKFQIQLKYLHQEEKPSLQSNGASDIVGGINVPSLKVVF